LLDLWVNTHSLQLGVDKYWVQTVGFLFTDGTRDKDSKTSSAVTSDVASLSNYGIE